MRRLIHRKSSIALVLILTLLVGAGFKDCSKQETKTAAQLFTELGNTKRDLKKNRQIDPQTDANITRALDRANRAVRDYVTAEQSRVANANNPNATPTDREALRSTMHAALEALKRPEDLGIKNADAQKLWMNVASSIDSVLSALDAL